MTGFFDKLFDFNKDGKLSTFEKATQFAALSNIMSESDTNDNLADCDCFECDDLTEDNQTSELEAAGLDAIDLEFMDEEERRETIEDAGLDPDDYDFY